MKFFTAIALLALSITASVSTASVETQIERPSAAVPEDETQHNSDEGEYASDTTTYDSQMENPLRVLLGEESPDSTTEQVDVDENANDPVNEDAVDDYSDNDYNGDDMEIDDGGEQNNDENNLEECMDANCPRMYMPVCVLVNNKPTTLTSECEYDKRVRCAKALRRMGKSTTRYNFLYSGECGPLSFV